MALDRGTGPRRGKSRRPPVVGEKAQQKARTPVNARARAVMDEVIQTGLHGSEAMRRIDALGLTDAEKRDLMSYSRVRSQQSLRENDVQEKLAGQIVGPHIAKLLPGGSPASEAFDDKAWLAIEAAGILPFGRLLRGAGRAGAAGAAAAKVAKKQKKVPQTPEEKIVAAMPKAKRLRREQEAGYTRERAARADKAQEAMEIGGEAGYQAALRQLKGELPKLRMGDDLKNFDQATVDELFTHVQQMDDLRPYEKIRTQGALRKVLDGHVPTKSEIKALEHAFGPDLAKQVADSVGWWRHAKNMGLSVINIPRSVMASIDLSAPFRQGLVLGAAQPGMFAREWGTMVKSFAREGAYEDTMNVIASMPNYERMQKGKLALTDLEGIGTREDYFNSQIAETLTGGKKFSPVRMSGRGYTAFLNKFRADAFNHYLRLAEDAGYDLDDERLLRSLGEFINTATGRGNIKKLEGSMNALTAVFFSPRLIASRLQFFNPARYVGVGKTHPFVAAQNRKAARNLLGAIGLTLALAEMAGADVIRDPRSADFGKIKVGDTRVDITGGHQTYVVNAYRIFKGETVSSTTGDEVELEGGFGKPSRWSIAGKFLENKLAPVPQFLSDWGQNENFEGEPFDLKREGLKMVTPLTVGSTVEAYRQGGPGLAAATAGLGGTGFGVLTYGDDAGGGGGGSYPWEKGSSHYPWENR